MRVKPEWLKNALTKFREAYGMGLPCEVATSYNAAIQALVIVLDKEHIPYKIISLGAGAKKVSNQTDVCPKCHGSGRC
jgi:hypothetical protein